MTKLVIEDSDGSREGPEGGALISKDKKQLSFGDFSLVYNPGPVDRSLTLSL